MRKALFLLVVLGLLAGCGGDGEEEARKPPPRPKPKPLTLEVQRLESNVTTEAAVTVRGRVTPGATVAVGRERARVDRGRFQAQVDLDVGVNRIDITARKPGYRTEQARLTIRRREQPPAAQPAQQPASPCPPGQVIRRHMGSTSCGPPIPESCPPGQAPVAATARCEPIPREGTAAPKAPPSDFPPPGYSECAPGYRYTNEPPGGCVPK